MRKLVAIIAFVFASGLVGCYSPAEQKAMELRAYDVLSRTANISCAVPNVCFCKVHSFEEHASCTVNIDNTFTQFNCNWLDSAERTWCGIDND